MKGECPQCHRPPDFSNIGACPNCGRYDLVLVASCSADITVDNDKGLLWACPCGEFKWTSYAEWEKKQNSKKAMADIEADLRQATSGQGFTASQGLGSP